MQDNVMTKTMRWHTGSWIQDQCKKQQRIKYDSEHTPKYQEYKKLFYDNKS